MHGMHRRPDPSQLAQDLIASADSNGDGKISKSEFESLMQNAGKSDTSTIDKLFAYLDNNGDGSVSSQETTDAITAMVDKMRGQVMQSSMQPNPAVAAAQAQAQGNVDADGDNDGSRGESGRESAERQAMLMNATTGQSAANSPGVSNRVAFLIEGLLHQYQQTQANSPAQGTSLLSTSA